MEGTATPDGATQAPITLAAMPIKHLLVFAAGLTALFALVFMAFNMSREPDYRALFANLPDKDGGAVLAALTKMNVPHRLSAGGATILVPGDRVHEIRLQLASQGIPRGGATGFELIDTQRFGLTQFQERLNYQRALEGELARSIQSLAAVEHARVHLALPASSGFLRERRKPSASVLVNLRTGRTLDRAQVAGIVNLVAASVPELDAKQVSVVDQTGMLLSEAGATQDGLDTRQIGYTRRIESAYVQRIIDILEPIAGAGNVGPRSRPRSISPGRSRHRSCSSRTRGASRPPYEASRPRWPASMPRPRPVAFRVH
ncbi:MAG: flagellar basal-body MS-ring/collar protein FliF [Burkholderiaceae bacterium]